MTAKERMANILLKATGRTIHGVQEILTAMELEFPVIWSLLGRERVVVTPTTSRLIRRISERIAAGEPAAEVLEDYGIDRDVLNAVLAKRTDPLCAVCGTKGMDRLPLDRKIDPLESKDRSTTNP